MKNIHRYAYFPFGGGQRMCIGNNFAMMEMQIILVMACTQFNFKLADNFKLELEPLVTLRPKHGVKMKLDKVWISAVFLRVSVHCVFHLLIS